MSALNKLPLGVVLCLLLIGAITATTTPPGVKVAITQSGLQSAASVAIDILSQDLSGSAIPDQHGHGHDVDYDITNARVTSFTRPSSSMTLTPGGAITWSLAGAGASVHGDFHYKYKKAFVHISDHGSFDASASRVSLSVAVEMGEDQTGRPTISCASCSCSVGDVSIKFHGGASWIYNLFRHSLEHPIRDKLSSLMCDSVKKAINVKAAQSLADMKVQVDVGDLFTLDYRLVRPPLVTSSALEISSKGEFQWKASPSEAPFSPEPLQNYPGPLKMVSMCAADYVANTLAYVAHQHHVFCYVLTKKDLSGDDASFLNTTCKGTCVGNFLLQLKKLYPDASVEITMVTTAPPTLNTTTGAMTGNARGRIVFNVRMENGSLAHAMTVDLEGVIPLSANITNNKVQVHFNGVKFNVLNISSDIGEIPKFVLTTVLNFAERTFILPKLNAVGEAGIDLPSVKYVQFVNPALYMLKGAICFNLDVRYDDGQDSNHLDIGGSRPGPDLGRHGKDIWSKHRNLPGACNAAFGNLGSNLL